MHNEWIHLETSHTDAAYLDGPAVDARYLAARDADFALSERLGAEIEAILLQSGDLNMTSNNSRGRDKHG